MNPRRVGVLLVKDLLQSPKNFIFVWAVVAPVAISLIVTLVFGTLFSEKPKLGITDEGSSALTAQFTELTSLVVKEYGNVSDVMDAAGRGAVDMGIVLPEGFDADIARGEAAEITAFVWGESLAKNRTILTITVADEVRALAGQAATVDIEVIALGDASSIPWDERLLPIVVLMAVFVGGLFLPASGVIDEKVKKTFQALVITPASVADIFIAKGLVGIFLSLFMGVAVLVINQAFGTEPALLVVVLALGAVMAGAIGLTFGALLKDFTTLFAIWKLGGILLFGPAIVYMFPQIPEWVGRVFPTYYIIQPIIEISQRGGAWSDIAFNVLILIGLDALLIGVVVLMLKRVKQYAV